MSTITNDPTVVLALLREMLWPLLGHDGGRAFRTAAAIPADAELSTLGITSIDFVEFALAIEQQFQLAILDSIAPEELPDTLCSWQQYVCSRLASAA